MSPTLRTRLVKCPHKSKTAENIRKDKKQNGGKPKRQLNPYIRFFSIHRQKIMKMFPNENAKFCAAKAGELWRHLSEKEKLLYRSNDGNHQLSHVLASSSGNPGILKKTTAKKVISKPIQVSKRRQIAKSLSVSNSRKRISVLCSSRSKGKVTVRARRTATRPKVDSRKSASSAHLKRQLIKSRSFTVKPKSIVKPIMVKPAKRISCSSKTVSGK